MNTTLAIIKDETFQSDTYGCLMNGDLHVTPSLYDRIFKSGSVDMDLLSNLEIIDVDEQVYIENLEFMTVFSGQQVRIFDQGIYIGDGTVTCYPYRMRFEKAEVMIHFPDKGEVMIADIRSIEPILSASPK